MKKGLKGSKSVYASDESSHSMCMYVTQTEITFCDYFSYFIHLATLRQITLETMDGVIMHGNFFN